MKERPILFNADMVNAILTDRKTQTRRVIKGVGPDNWLEGASNHVVHATNKCPYGQPGDRLWVRESFWGCDLPGYGDQPCVVYDNEWQGKEYKPEQPRPWARKFGRIPSIHMPRDCSRILLEIVSVRVERLQDISERDARQEGVGLVLADSWPDPKAMSNALARSRRAGFRLLWESINSPDSWDANPWVWVVEFRRVEP